mmetsp:Transcript_90424/g.289904  ORF Transcript_90424/g.289904 Transcript_90424/m.289904 type:complete len:158 (-) Transcript_90424:165-638(-)
MGMVACAMMSPAVCGGTAVASAVAGCCPKVRQSKCRNTIKISMIVSAVVLPISTFILFQFSNPGSSGGADTMRPLSPYSAQIAVVMALAWAVPLTLSCIYPCYGEMSCLDLKDEEVPTDPNAASKSSKIDPVVLVLGSLNWLVIVAVAILVLIFSRS